jgi:hypothetical protein
MIQMRAGGTKGTVTGKICRRAAEEDIYLCDKAGCSLAGLLHLMK